MIRWTFYFEEGNVVSDITEDLEDVRVQKLVDSIGLFPFKNPQLDFYINPEKVKLVSRQIVDTEKAAEDKPSDSGTGS